jgi:hypothetical protein
MILALHFLGHCMLLSQDDLKQVTYYSNEWNVLKESEIHNKGTFQFLTLQIIEWFLQLQATQNMIFSVRYTKHECIH